MNSQPLLSVCVATYNRGNLLTKLLASQGSLQGISNANPNVVEWIIVDDGSTDNTYEVVNRYCDELNIKYFYQSNNGRAKALKKAIMLSSGLNIIIMDSDDYFLRNGLADILNELTRLKDDDIVNGRRLIGLLFGVEIVSESGFTKKKNYPPCETRTNYISARADFKCKGDLKEVVRACVVKDILLSENFDERRVPTFLLWTKVSMVGDCLMLKKIVAKKQYTPNGMTANIFNLKISNCLPMAILYELLAKSTLYKSLKFRIKSRLMWYRYALHSRINLKFRVIDIAILFAARIIYSVDKIRIFLNKKY